MKSLIKLQKIKKKLLNNKEDNTKQSVFLSVRWGCGIIWNKVSKLIKYYTILKSKKKKTENLETYIFENDKLNGTIMIFLHCFDTLMLFSFTILCKCKKNIQFYYVKMYS